MQFYKLEIDGKTRRLSLTSFSTEDGRDRPYQAAVNNTPQAFWKVAYDLVKGEFIPTLKKRVIDLRNKVNNKNSVFNLFLDDKFEPLPPEDAEKFLKEYDDYQISKLKDCLGRELERGDAVVFSDQYLLGNIVGICYYTSILGGKKVNYLEIDQLNFGNSSSQPLKRVLAIPHLTMKF